MLDSSIEKKVKKNGRYIDKYTLENYVVKVLINIPQ